MERIQLDESAVRACCGRIMDRLREKHIRTIANSDGPVVYISDTYPGVWMEHIYDGLVWAQLTGETEVAKNYVRLFLKNQRPDGQLPCFVWETRVGYCQLQECVSFGRLAYEAWALAPSEEFLREIYAGTAGWVRWLRENRMRGGHGLVEMYGGYDAGHDNSGRLDGMKYHGNVDDLEASSYPEGCGVAPLLAPDINACFYGNHLALGDMAQALGLEAEAAAWRAQADEIRARMFQLLWNEEDQFFYDVDRHGNQRKCRNISITNVITEGVLTPEQVHAVFDRYFRDPREFGTPWPYPSVSGGDAAFEKRCPGNSWGYYCQGLTMLRTLRWMKAYGLEAELHGNMKKWLYAWTKAEKPFGQELDPFTGEPSQCSPWYSATMLFFLAAAREMGIDFA